jgi:drug/metabolite transporter (DMT)-like permease
MQREGKYWFPAKRYGWGWGLPSTWQGWLVLAAFLALVVAGTLVFPPAPSPVFYLVYIAVLVVLLLGVCWLKGEPPRWRWGNSERS